MKKYILLLSLFIMTASCEEYDQDILPLIGTYNSNIVNVDGPFLISVTVDYGNQIFIEAPFDGIYWNTISAYVDNPEDDSKQIDIEYQEISPGEFISGRGVYFFDSIQLDYRLEYRGEIYDFSLVGTKN